MGKHGLNFTPAEITASESARRRDAAAAPLSRVERISWWVRTLCNIYSKLYQGHFADFCRDNRAIISSLDHFREGCKSRGWQVPDAELERLLGKLVARCQEAIVKGAITRVYIPGYFGKAVARFLDEIADQASRRWKHKDNVAALPPELFKEIVAAAAARTLGEQS